MIKKIHKQALVYIKIIFTITLMVVNSTVTAAPITLFQSDGTDASIFNNLTTIGEVYFNRPLANIFGRDTNLTQLPSGQQFTNDFFGTLADGAFQSFPDILDAKGIIFGLGNFNKPVIFNDTYTEAGINWQISVPQDTMGTGDRKIHVQFGNGQPAQGGHGGGRQAVLHANPNVPGRKVWGQFINDLRIPVINGDIATATAIAKEAIIARKNITSADDPRIPLYLALIDGTQFVDPIESFYIDLVNDNGNPFDFELGILFANTQFETLAQFLDDITVEIGSVSDFNLVYDDIVNNRYVGAAPFSLDLNAVNHGQGGNLPLVQINSVDFFEVPEPNLLALFGLGLIGIFFSRKNNNSIATS